MNRSPNKRSPSPAQSAAQQAVLNKLRSGGTIQGAQPNNPLAYAAQFFDPRRLLEGKPPTSSIPNLRGGMAGGREALIAPGGWNKDIAGLGEITVGGQRFFPAQSGKDLVYQRAPGLVGGQYGSIRVPDQLASSVETPLEPAERAYKQDLSRAKQLAEQDQLAKKYQVAELTKAYNTASPEEKSKIGLQIWATTNPELAQRLKPGQTGYSEAVTAFQSQSPLGAIAKAAGDVQYADLGNKAFTSPTGPGGVPLGFSPGQLQTPLTGIEIPSTDKIGVSEFFSNTTPAPGAMEAFTDPLSILSPEKLDNAKRALLIQAFNKSLK
jgi:hypothetical protein